VPRLGDKVPGGLAHVLRPPVTRGGGADDKAQVNASTVGAVTECVTEAEEGPSLTERIDRGSTRREGPGRMSYRGRPTRKGGMGRSVVTADDADDASGSASGGSSTEATTPPTYSSPKNLAAALASGGEGRLTRSGGEEWEGSTSQHSPVVVGLPPAQPCGAPSGGDATSASGEASGEASSGQGRPVAPQPSKSYMNRVQALATAQERAKELAAAQTPRVGGSILTPRSKALHVREGAAVKPPSALLEAVGRLRQRHRQHPRPTAQASGDGAASSGAPATSTSRVVGQARAALERAKSPKAERGVNAESSAEPTCHV